MIILCAIYSHGQPENKDSEWSIKLSKGPGGALDGKSATQAGASKPEPVPATF